MSRPPAATKGIMYETPVMRACWMRLPQPSCDFSSSASAPTASAACTRWACGSSMAATASATMASGSLTARLTPDSMTGSPAKRLRPLTPTSVAKMTASAALMTSGGRGS